MKNSETNFKKLAQEWFDRADDDLLFAKAGFKETKISHNACFLSQQVAEKYLKGYLTNCGINPPRVHNLLKLLDKIASIDKNFKEMTDDCILLNPYYNPARYPDDVMIEYSEGQAKEALSAAEKIVDFVKKKIY